MKVYSLSLILALAAANSNVSVVNGEKDDVCNSDGSKNYYDAETFFETTTYVMASSVGYAFNSDSTSLLFASDETGIFNMYSQPINGSSIDQPAVVALSNSTTNAIFPLSYFPNDDRILYRSDNGGNELYHIYVRSSSEDGLSSPPTIIDLTPTSSNDTTTKCML